MAGGCAVRCRGSRGHLLTACAWCAWQWMNIEHVVSEMSSFQFSGTRPASWQSAPDAWLHGYWAFGWADNHVKIASIDTANSTITVDPATPPVYRFQPTARYYGENILTELDAPGEVRGNADVAAGCTACG